MARITVLVSVCFATMLVGGDVFAEQSQYPDAESQSIWAYVDKIEMMEGGSDVTAEGSFAPVTVGCIVGENCPKPFQSTIPPTILMPLVAALVHNTKVELKIEWSIAGLPILRGVTLERSGELTHIPPGYPPPKSR